MLHYIKGKVTETLPQGVVIENGGIGYELSVPSSSALYMASKEETVTAYTAMIVREDDVSLYGFDDRQSLMMFRLLMTVTGIGAKAALAVLSALSTDSIKKAIVFDDPDSLAKAQGIGKKSAQRIVLELKDKVDIDASAAPTGAGSGIQGAAAGSFGAVNEAIDALVTLGYSKTEAAEAVAASGLDNATAEEYIKAALKKISKL